jgi:hypothetical protein
MKEFDIKIVITDSFIHKPPEEPGYTIFGSQPINKHGQNKQQWRLIKTEQYQAYRDLDLTYDIKSISKAMEYLNGIQNRIDHLELCRKHLIELLKDYH